MTSPPFKIAIVGLGSKGLYGFERILAQLNANSVKKKVEIHLFNKTRFMCSGDVYRRDQPGYMLMNFANKFINMWPEESPPPVVKHPLFNEIYSFSGLDAASHQEFDSYYFGKLNRIAYGPPPENLKKILALANLGIVDFQFAKSPNVEPFESGFLLSNSISEIYCDTLVDARIPKNSMEKEATGLFTNLCENRLARPFELSVNLSLNTSKENYDLQDFKNNI